MGVSKTQIDRLGDRLKGGPIEQTDLHLLDDYRRSFGDAHDAVVSAIRDRLSLQPTGRPAKSTTAIVDKLRRESVRLSQIQDIAGCRLVVSDVLQQDAVVESLCAEFAHAHVIDRRTKPSHGYRAVPVVANSHDKTVEIQVRTGWQHQWAEFSEKCADAFGAEIKYGGGRQSVRELLSEMSAIVAELERIELKVRSEPTEETRELARRVGDLPERLLSVFERATTVVLWARKQHDLSHRV